MLRNVHRQIAAAALCMAACTMGLAGEAGRTKEGVVAAGVDEYSPLTRKYRPPLIQHRNPFKLTLSRKQLPKHGSGISEVLVQYYDPETSKWRGYGLMELKRERLDGGGIRVVGASLDFTAPAEGIYSLRTVARSEAGVVEPKPADLSDVDWVVVWDRTPPTVKLIPPKHLPKELTPGRRVTLQWEIRDAYPVTKTWDETLGEKVDPHTLETSHDGGLTWKVVHRFGQEAASYRWKVEGPNTSRLMFRITARDAAGNLKSAILGGKKKPLALRVAGFKPLPEKHAGSVSSPAVMASSAQREYQRGVVYMTRGDYQRAVKHFAEAMKLFRDAKKESDPTLLRTYVDLSATYLNRYDQEKRQRLIPNTDHLDRAKEICEKALAVPAFKKEPALHFNLAQAHYRLSQMKAAEDAIRQGLKHSPRHLESLYMLALIKVHQKHMPEAKKLWKQVAALGGRDNLVAVRAVQCLRVVEREERKREAARQAKLGTRPAPEPSGDD
jgi:Tfp pilus assembly protein PilF